MDLRQKVRDDQRLVPGRSNQLDVFRRQNARQLLHPSIDAGGGWGSEGAFAVGRVRLHRRGPPVCFMLAARATRIPAGVLPPRAPSSRITLAPLGVARLPASLHRAAKYINMFRLPVPPSQLPRSHSRTHLHGVLPSEVLFEGIWEG